MTNWIDLLVIGAYLIGTTLFGCSFAFRRRGGGDAESFTTGGGRLPTWTVALSIFATHVSSIAFLGLPAKAYLTNWNPYVLSITVPIAAVVAVVWFVPFYRNSGSVSAYSFLEVRYGVWARLYASLCFLVMQSARSGVILFLMAMLIKALMGCPVIAVIAATGLATTAYSMMGGISAVVWTDSIQSLVLIVGTLLCMAVLCWTTPDLSASLSAAADAGKFSLGGFTLSDWSGETFWVIFIYSLFINLQNFGIDQSFTQRYVAAKSRAGGGEVAPFERVPLSCEHGVLRVRGNTSLGICAGQSGRGSVRRACQGGRILCRREHGLATAISRTTHGRHTGL